MKFLSHDGLLYFWKKVKSYVDTKYNELFQSVSNGKTLVASAITDKGITTDATATFSTMANNIQLIETGTDTSDATALSTDVLINKTFYANNEKAIGVMVDNGAVTSSLNAGGSYTIPKGYHNGNGKVTANSLASQTSGTATAGQILSGQTAFVNGNKVTGTLALNPNLISGTNHIECSNSTIAVGALSSDGKQRIYIRPLDLVTSRCAFETDHWFSITTEALGITPDKIAAGNTVLGITGTGYGKWS